MTCTSAVLLAVIIINCCPHVLLLEPKDNKKWTVISLLEKLVVLDMWFRGMSAAVVGCCCGVEIFSLLHQAK